MERFCTENLEKILKEGLIIKISLNDHINIKNFSKRDFILSIFLGLDGYILDIQLTKFIDFLLTVLDFGKIINPDEIKSLKPHYYGQYAAWIQDITQELASIGFIKMQTQFSRDDLNEYTISSIDKNVNKQLYETFSNIYEQLAKSKNLSINKWTDFLKLKELLLRNINWKELTGLLYILNPKGASKSLIKEKILQEVDNNKFISLLRTLFIILPDSAALSAFSSETQINQICKYIYPTDNEFITKGKINWMRKITNEMSNFIENRNYKKLYFEILQASINYADYSYMAKNIALEQYWSHIELLLKYNKNREIPLSLIKKIHMHAIFQTNEKNEAIKKNLLEIIKDFNKNLLYITPLR